MKIQVLHFASAKEAAGCASEALDLPDGATVADAKRLLGARHPRLETAWKTIRFAVGERFAPESHPLEPGDVVALLPPVSGG